MIRAVIFDYDWVLTRYYFVHQRKMFKLAQELRAKGIKTAMLSNRINPLSWLAKKGGWLKDFDLVVFASDSGYSKPDPQAFNVVLDGLRLTAEQCLFIDNRAGHVKAARQLGIHTIEAESTKQAIADIKKQLAK